MADVAVLGLRVDASGAIVATDQLAARLNRLAGTADTTTSRLGRLASGFLTFAAGALAVRKFVDESVAAQNAQAQLEAAVRSTGGAAGRTVAQMQALATQLQDFSTFSDEAVQGAQAILNTFTKINGQQFDEATRAVVDLASRMGGDLSSAALQVGKALNDPKNALGSLSRVGIQFSDAQEQVIKRLIETGQTAKAQQVILAELRTQFGGSAAAARNTLGGALEFVKNKFGELFEVSRAGSGGLVGFLNTVGITLGVIKKNADVFIGLAKGIGAAGVAYGAYATYAKLAAGYTALLAATQTIAAFISLAKGVRSVADAMALLSIVGKGAAGAVVALAAIGVGFLAYKKLAGEVAAETAKFNDELDRLNSGGGGPTAPTGGVVDEEAIKAANDRKREVLALNALNADRVRLAKQEYGLVGQANEALAIQQAENKAINDRIAARNDLEVKLVGLSGRALETQRQRNAIDIAAVDRSIEFVRQTEIAGAKEAGIIERRKQAGEAEEERQARVMKQRIDAITRDAEAENAIRENFLRQFQQTFANGITGMLTKGLDSWREFFASVKDLYIRLLADVASAALVKRIGPSIAGAAGLGQKAFNPATDNPFEIPSGSSTASKALGWVGIAVAGFSLISDSVDLFGDKAKQATLAQDRYTQSLEEFAIVQRTSLADALQDNIDKANELAATRGKDFGVALTGGRLKDADDIKGVIDALPPNVRGLGEFRNALIELEKVTRRNEEALRSRNRAELDALAEDLDVRSLRARGLNEDADALSANTAAQREFREALDKYGVTVETVRLQTVQAEEATRRQIELEKERIKTLEESRRRQQGVFLDTLALTDPRAAAQANAAEDAANRVWDAIQRGASDAEIAAIEFYNAALEARRVAERLAQDTRDRSSSLARIAAATGNTRLADDITRSQSNADQIAAAIASGMTPFNLELLKLAQQVEASQIRMVRAIEDGTRAINKQADADIAENNAIIDAIRTSSAKEVAALEVRIEAETRAAATLDKLYADAIASNRAALKAATDQIDAQIEGARMALDVAKEQLSQLEKSVATNQKVVEALDGFLNASRLGDLSTLSPLDKKAEAERQFAQLLTLAQGGDAEAAGGLPSAATALLQAAKAFDGSTPAYVAIFDRVQSALAGVRDQFGATLPVDQLALEQARKTVAGIERQIEALGRQKEALTAASDKEVAAIEATRQKAADDSAAVVAVLREQQDKVSASATAEIAKLTELNTSIRDAANAQIQQLIDNETQAHNDRVAQLELWQSFLNLTSGVPRGTGSGGIEGGINPYATPGPSAIRVADSPAQIASANELKGLRSETVSLRADLNEALGMLRGITVAASTSNDRILSGIERNTASIANRASSAPTAAPASRAARTL